MRRQERVEPLRIVCAGQRDPFVGRPQVRHGRSMLQSHPNSSTVGGFVLGAFEGHAQAR